MSMEENYRDVSEIRMLSFYAMEDLSHGDLISHVAPGTPGIPDTHTYRFCATKQPNTNLASYQVFEPNRRSVKAGEIFTAAAFYGFVTNEDQVVPAETITELSQDLVTGEISYTNEDAVVQTASVTSSDAGNILSVGSDGGSFFQGQGLVEDATFDDATNEITITFIDGPDLVIPIVDNIGQYISTTIYTNDGTLTGNRIVDGDGFNHQLDFQDLSSFNIYATNFYSESQAGNTIENGATGISLQAMTTGQTLTLQGDIVNLGGVTDTYVSFLNQDDTQNKVLVLDGSDKLFWRDAFSLSSNIYTADGTLLSNRVLNGDNYSFDLSMAQISNFGVEANEISLYSNGMGTLETNGDLNLLANENLTGSISRNTDLRSIPDWDLTSDLSGILYSGNDVLDIFSILGANIRGTGFFNKRTSNDIHHYIFAGDTTGTGGSSDTITLGITDFGLTNFITEFELVRDDGFGNGSYRVEVANPTSYYNFSVRNEGQLLETFANTGFTSQRSTDINSSFYDYLSNNHHYSLKFEEAGGQYLELHNQDTVGPENSYTRMFRTNIQNSVSDGILINGTTLDLTGFNVLNLNDYSGGEKVLVHDVSGDIRKSIKIEEFNLKGKLNIYSISTTLNPDETAVYNGAGLGSPFTDTFTLPVGSDKQRITVKVYSSDVLRIDVVGGGLIDGSTFIDIDGTIANKPSVTFVYSSSLGSWIII